MLASTLAFSSSASAVALIGNYSQSNDLRSTSISGTSQTKTVGFTLPTGSNYTLDDIVLRLGNYQSSVDTPLLQIYADATKTSTNPNGATLQSVAFTNPTSTSNVINNFTFTPTSSFTFLADTRYWLKLSNSVGTINWRSSNPDVTPTGIAGITFNGYLVNNTYAPSPSFFNTFQINTTAVTATAVPEPTSLPGYITFVGGLLAARKIVKFRAVKKVDLK